MGNRISQGITKAAMVLLALLCSASVSVSSDFFPLEPGLEWTYTDNVTANTGPLEQFYGVDAVPLVFWWPEFNGKAFWLIDDSAGPMLKGITVYEATFVEGHGWLADNWSFGFETAVRLFDLPITPGAELFDLVDSSMMDSHALLRTVGEAVNLETPYGVLVAYPVTLNDLSQNFLPTTFYVHHELGVVGFDGSLLTSVSGLVEVENKTWDGIKSLFR